VNTFVAAFQIVPGLFFFFCVYIPKKKMSKSEFGFTFPIPKVILTSVVDQYCDIPTLVAFTEALGQYGRTLYSYDQRKLWTILYCPNRVKIPSVAQFLELQWCGSQRLYRCTELFGHLAMNFPQFVKRLMLTQPAFDFWMPRLIQSAECRKALVQVELKTPCCVAGWKHSKLPNTEIVAQRTALVAAIIYCEDDRALQISVLQSGPIDLSWICPITKLTLWHSLFSSDTTVESSPQWSMLFRSMVAPLIPPLTDIQQVNVTTTVETETETRSETNIRKRPRPKSAFMYYFEETRAQIIQESPNISFSGLGQAVGQRWKLLSQEEKVKRYEEEKRAFLNNRERTLPRSAFTFYKEEAIARIIQESPSIPFSRINQAVGHEWNALSQEEKEPFIKLHEEEKQALMSPPTAYELWFKDNLDRIIKGVNNPDVTCKQINTSAAALWQYSPETQKQYFARVKEETQKLEGIHNPPPKEIELLPWMVAYPFTPWSLFAAQIWPTLYTSSAEFRLTELIQKWHQLPETEKQVFEQEAKHKNAELPLASQHWTKPTIHKSGEVPLFSFVESTNIFELTKSLFVRNTTTQLNVIEQIIKMNRFDFASTLLQLPILQEKAQLLFTPNSTLYHVLKNALLHFINDDDDDRTYPAVFNSYLMLWKLLLTPPYRNFFLSQIAQDKNEPNNFGHCTMLIDWLGTKRLPVAENRQIYSTVETLMLELMSYPQLRAEWSSVSPITGNSIWFTILHLLDSNNNMDKLVPILNLPEVWDLRFTPNKKGQTVLNMCKFWTSKSDFLLLWLVNHPLTRLAHLYDLLLISPSTTITIFNDDNAKQSECEKKRSCDDESESDGEQSRKQDSDDDSDDAIVSECIPKPFWNQFEELLSPWMMSLSCEMGANKTKELWQEAPVEWKKDALQQVCKYLPDWRRLGLHYPTSAKVVQKQFKLISISEANHELSELLVAEFILQCFVLGDFRWLVRDDDDDDGPGFLMSPLVSHVIHAYLLLVDTNGDSLLHILANRVTDSWISDEVMQKTWNLIKNHTQLTKLLGLRNKQKQTFLDVLQERNNTTLSECWATSILLTPGFVLSDVSQPPLDVWKLFYRVEHRWSPDSVQMSILQAHTPMPLCVINTLPMPPHLL
jgi:hypothetical protein